MTARIDPFAAAPELMNQFYAYSSAVNECGLERSPPRARQGSFFADQRLCKLPQHAHSRCTKAGDRERAALAWTEYLTQVSDRTPLDDPYEQLDAEFSKEEQLKLTLMIDTINGWNRLAVGFHLYEPKVGW